MKKYLLDTHVLLWLAENSPMLSSKAKNVILDTSYDKYVSLVSAWEVAIKLGTNKLQLAGGLIEFYRMIDENGFTTLTVTREYLMKLSDFPDYHKDPFDRLLISTALAEDLTIITIDENIQKYDVSWIW